MPLLQDHQNGPFSWFLGFAYMYNTSSSGTEWEVSSANFLCSLRLKYFPVMLSFTMDPPEFYVERDHCHLLLIEFLYMMQSRST